MSLKLVSGSVILFALIISPTSAVPQCVCARKFAPVCGSDGNVYTNNCLLECTKSILNSDLKVVNEGPCMAPDNCACVRNYLPVCGTDGVTYDNTCLLRCAREKNPTLEVLAQGRCTELKRTRRGMPYERRYSIHRRYQCSSK